jgi:hypothetical protein
MDDHAFTARTEAVDSTPAASFFVGCSVAPLLGPFRTRNVGNLLGVSRLQKVLKVAVLREDIVERFVHNIIRGSADAWMKAAYWSTCAAVTSSNRTEAQIWRI